MSEIGSIPITPFEKKYALICYCSSCHKKYFKHCINHLSGKCDCKNTICFICFSKDENEEP